MDPIRHTCAYILPLGLLAALSGCGGFSDSVRLHSIVGSPDLSDSFDEYEGRSGWTEDSAVSPWQVVFTGYGKTGVVDVDGDPALVLRPLGATVPDATHAALVVTEDSFGDLEIEATTRTTAQLREGSEPNAWEVGWLVWDYSDNDHFYYVIPKPNGWELGKRDPAYPGGQRFLATGESMSFPIGVHMEVRVRQRGAVINVWVDDVHLVEFTDTERPYSSGQVGLYTEDAAVLWDDVAVWDL